MRNSLSFQSRILSALLLLCLIGGVELTSVAQKPSSSSLLANSAELEYFEKKIRPVLVQCCYECHSTSAKKSQGGLDLDTREALLRGGARGPSIVPGSPDQSKLLAAIRFTKPDLQMPPKGKLPEKVIADISEWIKIGAPWPKDKESAALAPTQANLAAEKKKRDHWSWQPVRNHTPPKVKNKKWAKTPIDQNENKADIKTTADIRKRVVAEKMSTDAHNVKIITQDGKVTLRGPVKTEDEKKKIDEIAADVAGADKVDSQLEVIKK